MRNPGKGNLISWWAFEELSGTRYDSHGSYDLTDENTVARATGKVGYCANFELDNDEYLHIDSTGLYLGDVDFTFGFWAKPESTPPTLRYIFALSEADNDITIEVRHNQYDDFLVWMYDDAGTATQLDGGKVAVGTWDFWVVYYDSVNDIIGASKNAGTPETLSRTVGFRTGELRIHVGKKIGSTLNYDGVYDEMFMYKRVLSDAEIDWLYNGGTGRAYTELKDATGVTGVFLSDYGVM